MTNLERIRKMPPELLAELLVHTVPGITYHDDIDVYDIEEKYLSPCCALDYWDYGDCVDDTIDWLNEEVVDGE